MFLSETDGLTCSKSKRYSDLKKLQSDIIPVLPVVAMSIGDFVFDPDHCMAQLVYQSITQSLYNNHTTMLWFSETNYMQNETNATQANARDYSIIYCKVRIS